MSSQESDPSRRSSDADSRPGTPAAQSIAKELAARRDRAKKTGLQIAEDRLAADAPKLDFEAVKGSGSRRRRRKGKKTHRRKRHTRRRR